MIYDVDFHVPAEVERVFIAGAGGHARDMLSWSDGMMNGPGQPEFGGFLASDAAERRPEFLDMGLDYPMLSQDEAGSLKGRCGFLLGVGFPDTREFLFNLLSDSGLTPCGLIHPHALLGMGTTLGVACTLAPWAHTNAQTSVGKGVLLNPGARLGHDVTVGDFSCLFGTNAINGYVSIGRSAQVGAGAVVHPGLSIGDRSVVGMGSVVVRKVAPDTSVFGNPAKRLAGS